MAEGLAESVRRIPRSGIREVFDRCDDFPDVLSLAVGEPGEQVPAHITAAALRAIESGQTRYTNVLGVEPFRAAAADYARGVKGLAYDAATEIQAVPGATFGIYLALRALLDPGDEVIIPTPAFTSYDPQVLLAGGRPVHVPLRPENGMRLDTADVARAVTARTKVVIVNSPANPVGAVTPRAELERLAALCRARGLWVISDEVYHAFVYGRAGAVLGSAGLPVAPTIAAEPGMRERTVVVESMSKTFAMTGWRIGYLMAPAGLIEATSAIAELVSSSNNAPAQFAAAAALSGPLDHVAEVRDRYQARRDVVLDLVAGCRTLACVAPEGAFYAFLDVRGTGLGSQEFAAGLLEAEHVAVVPGEAFGEAGSGFVRLSYAGPTEQVAEAVRRLVRFASAARPATAPDLVLAR